MILALLLAIQALEPPPLFKWKSPQTHEVVVLAAAVSLIWIDVGQTRHAMSAGRREIGFGQPLLGEHPSQGKVFWMGGVLPTLLLTGFWLALPSEWRMLPCGGVIGGELYAVVGNAQSGFPIFSF